MKNPYNFNPFFFQRDVTEFLNAFTKDEINPFTKWVKESQELTYDNGIDYPLDEAEENKISPKSLGRKQYIIPFQQNDNDVYNTFIDKLAYMSQQANMRYGFDLDNFLSLNYFEYTSDSDGNGLPWHMDISKGTSSYRKMSFTLQLSDEDEYTGGQMEVFIDHNMIYKLPKTYGTLSFFPSYMVHRVTNVLSGTRKAIVGFIGGKPFK